MGNSGPASSATPTQPQPNLTAAPLPTQVNPSTEVRPLAIVERETIEAAIAYCDGNIPKAAALLEVSPSTIYRKKQSWD